jgi:hypothetical protein
MICFTALLSEGRNAETRQLNSSHLLKSIFHVYDEKYLSSIFAEMNGRKSAHKNRKRLTLGCSRKSAASGKKKK